MQVSYILFSGTPNPSSFCIHTLLYRVIVNSDNSIIFTFETAISEKQEARKQIKKLKLANKQADIQAFFITFAFETAISETAVSKNNIKKKL